MPYDPPADQRRQQQAKQAPRAVARYKEAKRCHHRKAYLHIDDERMK